MNLVCELVQRVKATLKKFAHFLKEKNREATLMQKEVDARKADAHQRYGHRFPWIR
jgi:hypothetical protein